MLFIHIYITSLISTYSARMLSQDIILLFVHYRWNKDVVCQLGSTHIPPHSQQQHQEVFYFEIHHIKEACFGFKLLCTLKTVNRQTFWAKKVARSVIMSCFVFAQVMFYLPLWCIRAVLMAHDGLHGSVDEGWRGLCLPEGNRGVMIYINIRSLFFFSFSHLHYQHLFLCLTLASSAIDHSNRPPPTRPRFHAGIPWQQLSHLLGELLGWWCKHVESVGNFSECSDDGGWGVWGKLPSALSVAQLFIHLSSWLLSFLVLSRSWNKIIPPVGPDADCLLRLWGFHCAVIQEHQLQLIYFFLHTAGVLSAHLLNTKAANVLAELFTPNHSSCP